MEADTGSATRTLNREVLHDRYRRGRGREPAPHHGPEDADLESLAEGPLSAQAIDLTMACRGRSRGCGSASSSGFSRGAVPRLKLDRQPATGIVIATAGGMSEDPCGALSSRWDEIAGTTIHSRFSTAANTEDAPVLVLVHGLVISSLYMVPTAVRLAPFFPVLAPDLPGFGKSAKPARVLSIPELADALAGWLRTLGLQRVVLVGNSLGCQIIVEFATRYSSFIEAAVLAGPTMDPQARTAPKQVGRWLVDWTRERPSLAAAHARDYYEAGLPRAWQTFRYALEDQIEDKLSSLSRPTLVVRGSKDPIVPQRWAEEVTSALPHGRLSIIPGAPHVVNYSTPHEFTQLVRRFVPLRPCP